MLKLKCNVCGHEFDATTERHYIARDPGVTGAFSTLDSHDEENLYDAFDCPTCGSQYVAQGRKRKYILPKEDEEVSSDGA